MNEINTFKLKIEPSPDENIIWAVKREPLMSLDIVDDGFYLPFIEPKKLLDKWEKFKERLVKKEGKKCIYLPDIEENL